MLFRKLFNRQKEEPKHLIVFDEDQELKINNIIENSKLEFSYINDYGKDLFVFTANLFDNDILSMQSKFINRATKDIDKIIDDLMSMSKTSSFDTERIKEINFISHFYKRELEKYILSIREKKDKGINLFKEYDLYIEAADRFIRKEEVFTKEIKATDHFEVHLKQERTRDIERFKDKVNKLRTNKLYHSQTLSQMMVLSVTNEKLYEQIKEVIFILIPVLKNKNSISISFEQIKNIKGI